MKWLAYVMGLFVGAIFGFWLHAFWEDDLTGLGSPNPPSFDLFVPGALFVLATGLLVVLARRS